MPKPASTLAPVLTPAPLAMGKGKCFTPYREVNALVQALLKAVRAELGDQFVGMYLEGSLANGDFDDASDIDFVVVTRREISPEEFSALHAMHERINQMDSRLAIELEGSYLSQRALRRYDPACDLHPNIERGRGEPLKWVEHGEAWVIHRHILRQRGIKLAGPAPQKLVDPVTPDQLRNGMHSLLQGWVTHLLNNPSEMSFRPYRFYVVLSLCRILYTLQWADVVSKQTAMRWAQEAFGTPWAGLIQRAWVGRLDSSLPEEPDDFQRTLDFIRFTLEHREH